MAFPHSRWTMTSYTICVLFQYLTDVQVDKVLYSQCMEPASISVVPIPLQISSSVGPLLRDEYRPIAISIPTTANTIIIVIPMYPPE